MLFLSRRRFDIQLDLAVEAALDERQLKWESLRADAIELHKRSNRAQQRSEQAEYRMKQRLNGGGDTDVDGMQLDSPSIFPEGA